MDRRKDTLFKGVRLPKDYLKLVEEVFKKNFAKELLSDKSAKEYFLAYGELYPDELLLAVSLKHPGNLRMTTCYGSVDYPPTKLRTEAGAQAPSSSEAVTISMNQCVDAIASFFNTFFSEGRPVDYDMEYRQGWTPVELEKNTRVYLRINRDNPELEEQADELLAKDAEAKAQSRAKKKLH